MKRPLVRDVKDVIKRIIGHWRPIYLHNGLVCIWLKQDFKEVNDVNKECEKLGWRMFFYSPDEPDDNYQKFYIAKKEV